MKVGLINAGWTENIGDQLIDYEITRFLNSKNIESISIPHKLEVFSHESENGWWVQNTGKSGRLVTGVKGYLHPNVRLFLSILYWSVTRIRKLPDLIKLLKTCDALVYGGGQLFTDGPASITLALDQYILGRIAKFQGKKIYIYAVGLPQKYHWWMSRSLYSWLIKNSSYAAFRDLSSLARACMLRRGSAGLFIVGDAIFLGTGERREVQPHMAGITTLPYYDGRYFPVSDKRRYSDYLHDLAGTVASLNSQSWQVTFFPSNSPDVTVAEEVVSLLGRSHKIFEGNAEQFVDAVTLPRVFFSTRMHPGLIRLRAGQEAKFMAWDQKIPGVLQLIFGFNFDSFILEEKGRSGAYSAADLLGDAAYSSDQIFQRVSRVRSLCVAGLNKIVADL